MFDFSGDDNIFFQLYNDIYAARSRDGDLLPACRTLATRYSQEAVPFPIGKPRRREACVWSQNHFHVRAIL